MKINGIQNYNYKYNTYVSPKYITFGKTQGQDAFVQKTPFIKSVKYYDDMIAHTKAQLNEALDKYGCYDTVLNLKKLQVINVNRLENAPIVDFKKAKSLEEAKQFALDTFHIQNFDVNDLPTANFINECLSHLLEISHGNIFMPKSVSIVPITENTVKGEYKIYENEIRLSSEDFNENNIIDDTKELQNLSYWDRSKYDLQFNELKRVLFHELGHCNYYSNKAQNELQSAMEKYPPKLEELENTIKQYFSQIEQFKKEKAKLSSKRNPITNKLANYIYSKQSKNEKATKMNPAYNLFPVEEKSLPWDEKEKSIALLVSGYAIKDREEFVAETFAKMCMQDHFFIPKHVLDLYKESGGYIFL